MDLDLVLLIITGLILVLRAWVLRRLPLRYSYGSWLVLAFVLAVGATAYFVLPGSAGYLAAGCFTLLVLCPVLAARGAIRALRWGNIRKARALALITWLLRPTRAQRIFRRAVEVSWRLSRGEAVDIPAEVARLGLSPLEAAAQTLAFLSWTNDFEAMAQQLREPAARQLMLRSGLAGTVLMVAGETGGPQGLLVAYTEAARLGVLRNRSVETAWALVNTAAQLGAVELVEQQLAAMARDVPPERRAYTLATAQQRRGDLGAAAATMLRALQGGQLSPSAQRRLQHRRDHPATPVGALDEPLRRVLDDVKKRLHARRALAPLGLRLRQPSPLTWIPAASLIGAFIWQLGQRSQLDVYRAFGLWVPYSRAPDAYRLLSYAWLHFDTGHLLLNLLGLIVFGTFVEHHFGLWRYLAIYLAAALGGGVAFLLWQSELAVAMGASGAVFALVSATIVQLWADPTLRSSGEGRREIRLLGLLVVAQVVADLLITRSAGSAHLGGFVTGLVLGLLLLRHPTQAA